MKEIYHSVKQRAAQPVTANTLGIGLHHQFVMFGRFLRSAKLLWDQDFFGEAKLRPWTSVNNCTENSMIGETDNQGKKISNPLAGVIGLKGNASAC
ncbi:MAG: hypothetical protein IPJ18_07105 [Betaproteobacteria bacterium]|nr:hypothetical protein [Betaproteobacteria bacterium]